MHPLAGLWTVNMSKSRPGLNPQFHGTLMRVEISGDIVRLTYGGVNTSGQHEEQTQMVACNGQAHPVLGAPGLVTVGALGPRRQPSCLSGSPRLLNRPEIENGGA